MYSLSTLYHEYRTIVYRYIYHLCGDQDLTEELTQETFYQVVLSLPRFRGRSSVSTWLLAIARRVYLKYCRQRNRFSRQVTLDSITAPVLDMPEPALDHKQLHADLQRALLQLPERYRQVILWRELEGMSFEQIGVMLGKTPATVRVLLFRAKKRCRELLEEVRK